MAYLLVILTTSVFTWGLAQVQAYRLDHPEMMLGLPLLILLIAWDRARPQDVLSTRDEMRPLHEVSPPRPVRGAAGIKQIALTWAAHLVGASVGREAVGLQLAGWATRLRATRGWYFAACLATGFAIVLGTPFAAAVFVFESKKWNLSWTDWVGIPLLAWMGYRISTFVGVEHVEFQQFAVVFPEFAPIGWLQLLFYAAILVIVATALSFLFLYSLARASRRQPGMMNSIVLPFLFLSTVAIVFYVLGWSHVEAMGLPGLGTQVLPGLAQLEPDFVTVFKHPLLFGVVKVFLTAAFVGIGVRGGELTPLLVAGAMVAVGLGVIFHFPVAGFVAIGFPLIWGIAARRPFAAAILAIELFGFSPWAVIGIVTFLMVSAGVRLGDLIDSSLAKRYSVQIKTGEKTRLNLWRRGLYD